MRKAEPTNHPCDCRFRDHAPAHHDRLLGVETDPLGAVLELVELAATWQELEYSLAEPRIAPHDWVEFAMTHEWCAPARMTDLMIALSSFVPSPARPLELASVTPLFAVPADASTQVPGYGVTISTSSR